MNLRLPFEVGVIPVTGGTGFLGSYIIKELIETGYSVRAIRRGNKLPFYISRRNSLTKYNG